jgi:hypothetical protein
MSELRVVMEAFAVGELDYASLQRKLSDDLAVTETYESALVALDTLCRSENLSPAMANLLRRSIDRHFSPDDTDPFPDLAPADGQVTQAGEAAVPEDLPPIYAEDDAEMIEPPPPDREMATEELQAGAVLAGRYEIEGLIGRGGSGLVYRALDRCRGTVDANDARIALKVLRPEFAASPPARARLVCEGRAALELRHPNVVRVIDVGMDDDRVFVTMELLEGDTLRGAIVRRSPDGFSAREAVKLIRGIGEGLAYLHERSLVHGDLKPGNIFLTSGGVPKLLDFGAARSEVRAQEPTLEGGGAPARTPAYASPELLAGETPETRDDVFAFGCVACELASSRHPFGRVQSDEAMMRKLRPALPARLRPAGRRALTAALSFRRRHRPRDARALLGMMGLDEGRRQKPAFATGVLAGLAGGVLLVLSIIHPSGPVGRLLPLDPVPASGDATHLPPGVVETGKDTSGGAEATPPPVAAGPSAASRTDVAGRFVPGVESREEPGDGARPGSVATEPATRPPQRTPAAAGPGRLRFDAPELSVAEGSAVVIATVVRDQGRAGTITVRWRSVAGSAKADSDYIASDWREITLADGQASERIFVPIVDDGLFEGEESFFLELAEPGRGATLADPKRLEVRISDDESG